MFNSNTTTFLAAANIPQNPNPICTHTMEINSDQLDFEDFLILAAADDHEGTKETTSFSCLKMSTTLSQNPFLSSHENKIMTNSDQLDFEDFLILAAADDHEGTKEITSSSCLKMSTTLSQNPFLSSHENKIMTSSSINGSFWEVPRSSSCADYMQPNEGYVKTMERDDVGTFKIAFRTKSDLEIMDDGFKWRKYGKKRVKNSPNPRNYYRCSAGGCKVKKRVERDREDPRFVITTYEGKHNHESPSPATATCHTNAFNIPSAHCTLQPHTLQILHQP